MSQCKIKFLQGEDLGIETTLEAKDLLEALSNFKFTVAYDDPEKTIIVNTDNVNFVEIEKAPAKVAVGDGVPRKTREQKRPEVMPSGRK
jgi:hypothetical protein